VALQVPEEVVVHVPAPAAPLDDFVEHARVVGIELTIAAGQQAMRMAALGHALARLADGRPRVALDHSDAVVVVAEGAGSREPGETRPEDDGMLPIGHGRAPKR
jgi:hypothetical protein